MSPPPFFLDHTIFKCNLDCKNNAHFHCPSCKRLFDRRDRFLEHLVECAGEEVGVQAPTASCPVDHEYIQHNQNPSEELTERKTGVRINLDTAEKNKNRGAEINVNPDTANRTEDRGTDFRINLDGTKKTVNTEINIRINPDAAEKTMHMNTGVQHSLVVTAQVRKSKILVVTCPHCALVMNQKNLKRHIERKHGKKDLNEINSQSHLRSECLDTTNSIYAVLKSRHGESVPLHVQQKTWGLCHKVRCESLDCQKNADFARRSNIASFRCVHLKSIDYCSSVAKETTPNINVLDEMVSKGWLEESKKQECLRHHIQAQEKNVPLTVSTSLMLPDLCVSVFEPSVTHYSQLQRVMVVYNRKLNTWHCRCSKARWSCLHKYIAKWHFFQECPSVFRNIQPNEYIPDDQPMAVTAAETPPLAQMCRSKGNITFYPPIGEDLKKMVEYIFKSKRLPATLPDPLKKQMSDYPRLFIPDESFCTVCPGNIALSAPILITAKAKILTIDGIVQGTSLISCSTSK